MANAPTHAFLEFFLPHYIFQRLLSHMNLAETMDSGEKGMNPFTITTINPQKEWDQTSNHPFSAHYRLSYGAWQILLCGKKLEHIFESCLALWLGCPNIEVPGCFQALYSSFGKTFHS